MKTAKKLISRYKHNRKVNKIISAQDEQQHKNLSRAGTKIGKKNSLKKAGFKKAYLGVAQAADLDKITSGKGVKNTHRNRVMKRLKDRSPEERRKIIKKMKERRKKINN